MSLYQKLEDKLDSDLEQPKKRLWSLGGLLFAGVFVISAAIVFFWGSKYYDTSRYTDVGDGRYAEGMRLSGGQIVKDDTIVTTDIPGDDTGVRVNKNGDVIVSYDQTTGWKSSLEKLQDEFNCSDEESETIMQAVYDQTTETGHTCYSIAGIKHIKGSVYQIITGENRLYEFLINKRDGKFSVVLQKEVFNVESWAE